MYLSGGITNYKRKNYKIAFELIVIQPILYLINLEKIENFTWKTIVLQKKWKTFLKF